MVENADRKVVFGSPTCLVGGNMFGFLALDQFEADWFVRMNNTGGPVDLWAVEGIEETELVVFDSGHSYFPGRIPRGQLTLLGPAAPRARSSQQ